ncbi:MULTISPECIES: hypothetical protein [unclassified Bradyrhizobium]|uniref:hypothetical protein n=1 Tax=unclassified Bradyrhizobium TaxID=2631580 RepID=UPI0029165B8B|nr:MULTISPECIES: hypothetical protein [unclassified Bradyrhizobium]
MIFLLILVVVAVVGGAVAHTDSWVAGLVMAIAVPAGIWAVISLVTYLVHIP